MPSCPASPVTEQTTPRQARHHPPGVPGRHDREDQLGSLGLVLNAIVLWTTRYIDAAVALRPLSDADALELDEDDEGVD